MFQAKVGIGVRNTSRVNDSKLREQLTRDSRELLRDVGDRIVRRARQIAPKDSGRLRESIRAEEPRLVAPDRMTIRVVATAKHAIYQHEGTGICGPRGTRIRPRHAQALQFRWRKQGGALFYFRSVKGTKATKFLVRAVADTLSRAPWRTRYNTTLL